MQVRQTYRFGFQSPLQLCRTSPTRHSHTLGIQPHCVSFCSLATLCRGVCLCAEGPHPPRPAWLPSPAWLPPEFPSIVVGEFAPSHVLTLVSVRFIYLGFDFNTSTILTFLNSFCPAEKLETSTDDFLSPGFPGCPHSSLLLSPFLSPCLSRWRRMGSMT